MVYFEELAALALRIPKLNKKDLEPILIPVPRSIDEQRKIASPLHAVDRKMNSHYRKHAASRELFRTLLHQLMAAQIRVHDLDLDEILHTQ